MNLHNLKISFKNLQKNKLVTVLNIGGLALGITISLLTYSYVRKEKNMDHFLPEIENVYAISNFDGANISAPMVEHIRKEIVELSNLTFAQYEWSSQIFLKQNDRNYKVNKLLLADSAFFEVFKFKAVYGNLHSALSHTNRLVITQSLARKIFGNENPVGKLIHYNATEIQGIELEIAAVIEDLPHHSSWEFDAVMSMETNKIIPWFNNSLKYWGAQNFAAFCKIPANTNFELVKRKVQNIPLNEIPEGSKENIQFNLIPFTNCYFHFPDLDLIKHGNAMILAIIQITGVLILLLAWINYINIVTAQKLKRLRNIGILKVLGSKKGKIIQLITSESVLVISFTCIITLIISYFAIDGLNYLTKSNFTISEIFSEWNLMVLFIILTLTILVTGIIPGFGLGRYQTSSLLKNNIQTGGKNYLRNALMIFQFTISIVLLASILIINKQNRYMQTTDPGFQRENIIYVSTNPDIQKHIHAFNSELNKIPQINDYCYCSSLIGYNQMNRGASLMNNGAEQDIYFSNFHVTPNFFEFFGIKLKKGETFDQYSAKKGDWIFNETAIKDFLIKDLEQAKVINNNKQIDVIAETEDFHFESMHVPIRAVGFQSSGNVDEYAYMKISTSNKKGFENVIRSLENIWKEFSPDFPFEYKFLNSTWNNLYQKEQEFQTILNYASIISLILSCLGLVSLTFFMVEIQTKEIGIRKVNGAKVFEIVKMLNTDLIKWLSISFLLACPIAWYAMNKWLQNFAYKTELSWWIFVLAGSITIGIALLTVSWQSWQAAKRNPVECLRYE